MRILSFLLTAAVTLIVAVPASAQWTFDDISCSPASDQDLGARIPQALLMLDKSGSMDNDAGPNTCKVCEDSSGFRMAVDSVADCPLSGTEWTVDGGTLNAPGGSSSGYEYNFTLATPVAEHDMVLNLGFRGDFNGNSETVRIYADGVLLDRAFDNSPRSDDGTDCGGTSRDWFNVIVPASAAADGMVTIRLDTSNDVGVCSGNNDVSVELTHLTSTYLGTLTDEDPCGNMSRWTAAVGAIDKVTAESDAASPEYAHFGLAMFSSSTELQVDCGSLNHDPIYSYLDANGPDGYTATAAAIHASYQTACVASPPATVTRAKTSDVGNDGTLNGYDMVFAFANVPTGEAIGLEIELRGDFDGACEFATLRIDGDRIAEIAGTNCGTAVHNFTIPASYAADGALTIDIDTRSSADITTAPKPVCAFGDDGVQNNCSGSNANGATVRITHSNPPPPTTVILITDGAPTVTLAGDNDDDDQSQEDAVTEACDHRDTAPMFVVGLGGGTDVEFNDVLAAAGGTGSCMDSSGNEYDPCVNPALWSALYGLCDGSIQADNGDDLLTALRDITAQLACTFDVSFINSGVTSVPLDSTYEYAYFNVELGGTPVSHINYPGNPTPGEGWEFTSDARDHVVFSPFYCNNIQYYVYESGSTQLACLCDDALIGADCSVPDNVALGVCPDGVWVCEYGTEVCEPEADCCEAGVPCDTGLEGVCQAGTIVCDGPPLGTCVPLEEPTDEICDLLDNDCDGETDEDLDLGNCTVVGGLSGRCGQGLIECILGAEVCVPFGAMPELCNGLDDDCDGDIDNMSASWSKSAFSAIKSGLDNNGKAAACRFNDVCACPDGPAAAHAGTTFDEYLTSYAPPVCICGEGLASEDGPMSMGEPSSSESDPSACSTSGGASGGLATLFVFAFIGLRRRLR